MSRWYRISVQIENHQTDKVTAIKKSAEEEWPFEDWFELEGIFHAVAEAQLCGGETEEKFTERLSKAIWQANDGFCEVTVSAAYLEELPYETYVLSEEDYENLGKAKEP